MDIEQVINREIVLKGFELGDGKKCSFKVDMDKEEKFIECESISMRNDLIKWGQFTPLNCIIWRRGLGTQLYPVMDQANPNKKLISFMIENDKGRGK